MKRIIACSLAAAFSFWSPAVTAETWALQGKLLIPEAEKAVDAAIDGVVVVKDDRIDAADKDAKAPSGAITIADAGIILPGFINLHDHMTWNVLPHWSPGRRFNNRYEWQAIPEYDRALRLPQADLIRNGFGCKVNLIAEVRAIMGGATSVVGSLIDPDATHPEFSCVTGIARNLDHSSEFAKDQPAKVCDPGKSEKTKNMPPGTAPPMLSVVANVVFPMETAHDVLDWYRCKLLQGELKGLLMHLAEGSPTDASASREFRMADKQGLLLPGVAIIHGTALNVEDFKAMAANGVGLIWSPRSNEELYGGTASIIAARAVGVKIALAPDWSPSGSSGMLQEINYAAARHGEVLAQPLVAMATSTPAAIARLDDRIGKLKPGYLADLVAIRRRGGDPYQNVVTATAADVQLVAIGGAPVYGDATIMKTLLPGKKLEMVEVCGAQKALFLEGSGAIGGQSWAQIQNDVKAELQRYGSDLSVYECR